MTGVVLVSGEKYLTEMKTIMMVIMMQIMEIAITTSAIMMIILDPSVVLIIHGCCSHSSYR